MFPSIPLKRLLPIAGLLLAAGLTACTNNGADVPEPLDPDTAPEVAVDRFSPEAATFFVRENNPNLPGPNQPVNFDQAPFLHQGLGPEGDIIQYYHFDAMPAETAPIFVLFREGEDEPIDGQLNIINHIPGDEGYNDFWHVHKVTVPADYVANTVTSLQEINEEGFPIEETDMIVNCPVVPKGSTAGKRFDDSESLDLIRGWYKNKVVHYFSFEEKALSPTSSGKVPISPIFVTFNINGEPSSGFMTEEGGTQNHNVTATLPADADYSPLWLVNVYDNADFDQVMDLQSAQNANILANGAALVNCPLVALNP